MTIEIPLTRGLVAMIDDADGPIALPYRWYADPGSKTTYARRRLLAAEDPARRHVALHTVLTGWPLVDHRNGNGLDNRRANLRPATDKQNKSNMRKHRGASRFKGVSWKTRKQRWYAVITHNRRRIYLGSFTTEEAAALAYDAAARELFGEFAALNFPEPGERSALVE